jgi:hypothetical protein
MIDGHDNDLDLKKQTLAAAVNWRRRWKHQDQEVDPTTVLDAWVSEGYNRLKTQRKGAAKVYRLENAEGEGYTLRRKIEADYVSLLPGVVFHEFKDTVIKPAKKVAASFVAVDYEFFLHSAESIRNATRADVRNAVLSQPQIYPIEGEYKYLVGKTAYNRGIFVVWDEPYINREIWSVIGQERQAAGLTGKIKVYGHASAIWSQNLEFYQLPLMK